ncbi:hypothetical protein GCK72_020537 [Caenorhabditis remanei]|uniref:Uncharacterized protein n=1 Tax=Caenorhabditis remanei TaxID=31234 RepID=A0A6A5GFT3_CAERE|nr:hypothetical protein GCK72_020537 [Caenorhabditis remanei]KAF1753980.1 hypothetical protein GCK72_020537 [Caenorhabditis remanei]
MFDACLSLALSPITRIPNCGTAGCFLSNQFLYYWGISNMIFGFIVIILSITLLVKIQLMDDGKSLGSIVSTSQEKRFQQASKTTTCILLSSLLFLTTPSVCVGVVELMGFSMFELVGPFYYSSLLLTGISNGIIFLVCNREARQLLSRESKNPSIAPYFVLKRVAGLMFHANLHSEAAENYDGIMGANENDGDDAKGEVVPSNRFVGVVRSHYKSSKICNIQLIILEYHISDIRIRVLIWPTQNVKCSGI